MDTQVRLPLKGMGRFEGVLSDPTAREIMILKAIPIPTTLPSLRQSIKFLPLPFLKPSPPATGDGLF